MGTSFHTLCLVILLFSAAYMTNSPSAWFFAVLWVFPERMVGVVALSVYLFVWVPSYVLNPFLHSIFLLVYMLVPLPPVRAFRAWRGWDELRRICYPTVHIGLESVKQDQNKQRPPRVYAIAPHGTYGENIHLAFVLTETFADVVPVGASIMTWLPIVKDFCSLCGMISADKWTIIDTLNTQRRDILIVPEGMRGILYENYPERVPQRRGFIECAVIAGAEIVPVYMHGGVWSMYTKWPVARRSVPMGPLGWTVHQMQHWFLSSPLGYPFLFCWGELGGFFPHFFPAGKTLRVVHGMPIKCQKVSPSDSGFNKYVAAIAQEYEAQQFELLREKEG